MGQALVILRAGGSRDCRIRTAIRSAHDTLQVAVANLCHGVLLCDSALRPRRRGWDSNLRRLLIPRKLFKIRPARTARNPRSACNRTFKRLAIAAFGAVSAKHSGGSGELIGARILPDHHAEELGNRID